MFQQRGVGDVFFIRKQSQIVFIISFKKTGFQKWGFCNHKILLETRGVSHTRPFELSQAFKCASHFTSISWKLKFFSHKIHRVLEAITHKIYTHYLFENLVIIYVSSKFLSGFSRFAI